MITLTYLTIAMYVYTKQYKTAVATNKINSVLIGLANTTHHQFDPAVG